MTLDISMQEMMNAARAAGAAVPPAAVDPNKPAEGASDPGSSIFTSLQALGLKLEARKTPMAMIVVDSIEKMPHGELELSRAGSLLRPCRGAALPE